MSKRTHLTFFIGIILGGLFLIKVASVDVIFYPFGGRILSIHLPYPAGPCPLPSITIGAPKPGLFMIPPGRAYLFYQFYRPGPKVLGIATSPYCGYIFGIGTSLY